MTQTETAPLQEDAGRLSPAGRYLHAVTLLPRQVVYLVPTALIGLLVVGLANRLPAGGGLSSVALVLVLALLLVGSRYLGALELTRLRAASTPPIREPTGWRRLKVRHPLQSLSRVFADGHYWTYGLHGVIANPILAVATTAFSLGPLVTGALLATSPIWDGAVGVRVATLPDPVAALLDPAARTAVDGGSPGMLAAQLMWGDAGAAPWAITVAVAVGALALLLVPPAARLATLAHWALARLLLSRFPAEDLRRNMAIADAARTSAVRAEDTSLRRLERDIHDGPQQRLLRLQMELSTAERRLRTDPGDAAAPLVAARGMAAEVLEELRALSRGVAPPILQDRGLTAALEALGERGPVRTDVRLEDPVPDFIERSSYFIAAELVANALKHANGSSVRLRARTGGSAARRVLSLAVQDLGPGGARILPGHGLAGVQDRLAGLGGTISLDSPQGGPTVIVVEVPLS